MGDKGGVRRVDYINLLKHTSPTYKMTIWKDKDGNKLTLSEFFTRWGKGIKQVATNPTPIEKLNIEIRATFINLIGIITCLTALIIFRDKFFVSWFAYGLILIFIANLITTLLKFFGLREQKKFLKSLKEIDLDEIEEDEIDKVNKEFTEQLVKQEDLGKRDFGKTTKKIQEKGMGVVKLEENKK